MNRLRKCLSSVVLAAIVVITFTPSKLPAASTKKSAKQKLPELIASKSFDIPELWVPHKTLDRDFWFMGHAKQIEYVPIEGGYKVTYETTSYDKDRINKEAFMKEGGYVFGYADIFKKIFEDLHFRVCVREVVFYPPKSDNNLALEAEVEAQCSEGEMKQLSKLTDGSRKSVSHSSPPFSPELGSSSPPYSIEAEFTFKFSSPVEIAKASLSFGYDSGDGRYGYVPDHFALEKPSDSGWQTISGTEIKDNKKHDCTITFKPLKTDKIRLHIFSVRSNKGLRVVDYLPDDKPYIFSHLRYSRGDFHLTESGPLMEKLFPYLEPHFGGRFLGIPLGEWGNDFFFQTLGKPDKMREFQLRAPENRKETLDLMHTEYLRMRKRLHEWEYPFNSAFTIDHYGLEWGGRMSCTELFASPGSYQWQIAFTRGAARQYGTPWMVYNAYYLGWGAKWYPRKGRKSVKYAGTYPLGPDIGQSPQFHRRQVFLGYMSGANFMQEEGLPLYQDMDSDGKYDTTAEWEVMHGWYDLAKRHPDRGITYTPVAVVFPFNHGITPDIHRMGTVVWFKFPYNDGEWMISEVTHEMFPHVQNPPPVEQPDYCMCNATAERPYPDMFDALVADPPSGVLSADKMGAYKVVFFIGDINIGKKLADELKKYVKAGGTLLINEKQVSKELGKDFLGVRLKKDREESQDIEYADGTRKQCSAYKLRKCDLAGAKVLARNEKGNPVLTLNDYGKGKVILTLPSYMLDNNTNILPICRDLLKQITYEALPFRVEGDIEYIINRNKTGWVVTLMNNRGVYKEMLAKEIVDPDQRSPVKIILPWKPSAVKEWRQDKTLPAKAADGKWVVDITVPAGDVRVVAIRKEKSSR